MVPDAAERAGGGVAGAGEGLTGAGVTDSFAFAGFWGVGSGERSRTNPNQANESERRERIRTIANEFVTLPFWQRPSSRPLAVGRSSRQKIVRIRPKSVGERRR